MLDHCQWMYMQISHRCATNRAGIYPCGWMIFGTGEIPPKLDNPGTLGHHFNMNGSHHTWWFHDFEVPYVYYSEYIFMPFYAVETKAGLTGKCHKEDKIWPLAKGRWAMASGGELGPTACMPGCTYAYANSKFLPPSIHRKNCRPE